MRKRGQFYLLAAIILIAVIVGFAGISNYTSKNAYTEVYDLEKELEIEGSSVLDYGIYSPDVDDVNEIINNFVLDYSSYSDETDRDIFFIYGNKDDDFITIKTVETVNVGGVYLGSAGESIDAEVPIDGTITPSGGKVEIEIEGNTYEFDLKPGENFYFIIIQDVDEERYVITGENIKDLLGEL
jgi:hypothetical protein